MNAPRPARTIRWFVALLAALAVPLPLGAQALGPRRDVPAPQPACPEPAPAVSEPDRTEEAERLATRATEASLLGDGAEALRLLAEAATLAPARPDIAYRLARALEENGREGEALRYYCRFLALEPASPDAAEVKQRLDALSRPGPTAQRPKAVVAFQEGLREYDAGRLRAAERAFTTAAAAAPDWSAPLYNRALARWRLGTRDAAAGDFQRFLQLEPAAAEAGTIAALLRSTASRRQPRNPTTVLASGLLLPGLGHFTTDRPGRGLLVLGAAAAAVGAGLAVERVSIRCLTTPENGACPADQVLDRKSERPYLVPGIAAAVAVGVLGAFDAWRGARRQADVGGAAAADRSLLPPPPTGAPPGDLHLLRLRF